LSGECRGEWRDQMGGARFDPMRNAEEECGIREFDPMQGAEEECGMQGREMRRE
jgi:hypothetical protein